MALPKDLLQIIADLQKRVDALERSNQSKNIQIPSGGSLVLNGENSDPSVQNGKIYYNKTTHKFRKCTNGAWSDVS
ncbi:MAG: hypothetical protein M3Q44_04065 [bacterium]|nr:hypothetical protein [bacterium]